MMLVGTITVVSVSGSFAYAAKQKLKEWYSVGADKVIVTMNDSSAFTSVAQQEMLMDRKGYRIQALALRAKDAGETNVLFIIHDLGYSDRSFTEPSGVDGRFESVVRNNKEFKSLGESGKGKNDNGSLDFVHYKNIRDEQCLALRQYAGSDGAGDTVVGEALGSTSVEGYFCSDKQTNDSELLERWINSYTVKE